MKKIASFTLAVLLILLQPALICSADSGDTDKIVVSTAAQLEELAKKCSFDSFSKGLTVELSDDIDLGGSSFPGIPYFCGTFYGCGHTVKHLNLTQDGSDIGFFRYTSSDAKIRDLTVQGSVEPGGSASVVGGIAGCNGGVISGCEFSGTVKAIESAGGIAGKNTGVISACTFSGSVSAEHRAGGIAGDNSGTISGCTNSGSIDTTLIPVTDKKTKLNLNFDISELTVDDFLNITDIGGIAGLSDGIVSGCTNEGAVGYERIGYNVGGITGRQSGRVSRCINKGDVIGRKDVGGIVGQAEPYAAWDVSETSLAELKSLLADIQDDLKTFNSGIKENAPEIKESAKDLGECVDEAAMDIVSAMDAVSGNISRAKSAADKLISHIHSAVNDRDPDTAGKLLGELSELAENSADSLDPSKLTDLLEKLRSQDTDHDLTISVRRDLEKIKERTETCDKARSDDASHRSKSGRTVKELTSDVEAAVDSGDLRLARELAGELLSLAESASLPIDSDAVSRIIQKLSDLESTYIDGADELCSSVEDVMTSVSFERPDVKKLKSDAESISDAAQRLRTVLSDSSSSLRSDAGDVLDSCSALADFFTLSEENTVQLQTDYQTDISSLDMDKYSSGVITSCENHGDVSAETNVGGVAGSVACEVDIDAEDQLKLPAYLLQKARYVVFSVVSECKNTSDVTAKKECAGGIVGSADFGVVTHCESSGTMRGGDHCGGIAGKSLGNISSSYSRCLLYGDKYVGGIAGEGFDISDCRSYSYVKSEKEYRGSVAGSAAGTVKGCLFVENGVGGIDGISYSGSAEPVSYSEMMKLPDIPEWFRKITVTFVAKGETVAVKEVEFGGSIDKLPEVAMDGTRYWKWNDFDSSHIYYSQTIEGEYKDPKTTISTDEEVPLFLAEGNFYEGQKLSVASETADVAVEGEHGKLLGAYTVSVNGAGSVLRVRMRMPDKGTLYTRSGGKWVQTDYTTDGSYIVFDMENGSSAAFFAKRYANVPKWAVVMGTAAFAALIAAVAVNIKKKKKAKKSAAPEKKGKNGKNDKDDKKTSG